MPAGKPVAAASDFGGRREIRCCVTKVPVRWLEPAADQGDRDQATSPPPEGPGKGVASTPPELLRQTLDVAGIEPELGRAVVSVGARRR